MLRCLHDWAVRVVRYRACIHTHFLTIATELVLSCVYIQYICELLVLLIWAYSIELSTCYWAVLALSWSIQVVKLLTLLTWAYDSELLIMTFYWAALALSRVHIHLWAASLIDLSLYYWTNDIPLSRAYVELCLLLGLHLCCWVDPTILSYVHLHNNEMCWILAACTSELCWRGGFGLCLCIAWTQNTITQPTYLSLPDAWAFLRAWVM